MPNLPEIVRDDLILKALRRKFGDLYEWEVPIAVHTIGPHDPDAYDDFDAFRKQLIETATEALDGLSDQELMALEHPKTDQDKGLLDWWNGYLSDDLQILKRRTLPDVALGWGHPSFAPDYVYWSQMAGLSLHEATFVSIGCEPEKYTEDEILRLQKDKRKDFWPAFDFLFKRRDLLRGYFHSTGFGRRSMPLIHLKALFEHIQLEIPDEFEQLLERRFPTSVQASGQKQSESSSWKRERTSLLSLVAAMGCEGYKFDPNKTKNTAIADIGDDLDSVGLSLDQKTTRKWLNEAALLIDSDYWKK